MKNIYIIIIFILSIFMLTFPMIVFPEKKESKSETVSSVVSATEETVLQPQKSAKTADLPDDTVRLYFSGSKEIKAVKMRDYLYSVVASEIPLSYGEEAIKAQIVATHTYTLYRKSANKKEKYDLSDDPETSQAYKPKSEIKKAYGTAFDKYDKRLTKLIDEVYPYIITYKSKPILAVYHGMSGGMTESSENVWGGKLPYLTATESICDKLSPTYITRVSYTVKEANDRLFSFGITAEELLKSKIIKSKSGYVLNCKVGNKAISGGNVTSAFSLYSSNFDLNRQEDNIVFTVRGKGHGVGMSQTGADYMAKNGEKFTDILKHYYHGVKITKLKS